MGLFFIIISIVILAYSNISREVRIHKEKNKFFGYTNKETNIQRIGWILFVFGILLLII